ncbi:MAG: hypothetical protein NUV98_00675 [Candidatus Roizmanbacteria bacterium]|nr:hypothetical protein [Candidatus Roizmanbacteria bacterium]
MGHSEMNTLVETIGIDNGHPAIRYQEACYAELLAQGGTPEEQHVAKEIIEELHLKPYIDAIPQFWLKANLEHMSK